ncbi:MAG: 16S rRNA (cytosine(1402)-N(4))-methyltransferase RsmH [Nocardioidaceae bacterium]
MSDQRHVPVLANRVVALLASALDQANSVMVDATLGLAGHAEAILTRCPTAHVIGVDRDQQALKLAAARLEPFATRTSLVHAVYDDIPHLLQQLGLPLVQGVLFDLGVSSLQLDARERGFSYAHDAPLDMRMDSAAGLTAADILNTYSLSELSRVLSTYGEERFARRIASRVVRERAEAPFSTSARLVELIRESIPAPARRTGGNPAKRTFQALRIEVNDELSALERALPGAVDSLALGGRIVVLSYHSLEDRMAKSVLTARATSTAPLDLPVVPVGAGPELRLLTRGAETASAAEVAANPRAASVRLRAAERIRRAA